MIPVRVSFWYEFIPVLTYRSVFVYIIPVKNLIPVQLIPVLVYPGSYLSLYICLQDTGEKSHTSTTRTGMRFYM